MNKNVIISHPDGRQYSVSPKTFTKLYEGDGFKIDHEEVAADFIADVPVPTTRAGARRKRRKVIATPVAAPVAPTDPVVDAT